MKDIVKFAVSSLLMMVMLTMVNLVFVQAIMGDFAVVNLVLTVLFTLVVVAAAAYDGIVRGAKDCKYTDRMRKQQTERGYVLQPDEEERLFKPSKGFIAGALAAAPAVVMIAICMIFNADGMSWMINFLTRLSIGYFLGLMTYLDALTPWIYLPLALVYPAVMGAAYTFGPKLWAKQQADMEKAKREKRRKVNRRRKKKTA